MNLNEKFMREVAKIQEPEVFIGLARLLGAPLIDSNEEKVRDFGDIFEDMMASYSRRGRKIKRELIRLVEKSNKIPAAPSAPEEDPNGNSTQDSNS